MKPEHRMEAKSPDPDDLTSEVPPTPASPAPADASAPHVPPVKR